MEPRGIGAYKKYKKYKKKYVTLKQQLNSNYYLLHGTDTEHLKKILQQGFILSGRYLPDDETRLGGWEKLPYVYCSIYFDDIKNLSHSFGYSFIIDPRIIWDSGMIFNKGWMVHPTNDSIIIRPHDVDYDNKINSIKEYIKNPPGPITNLPPIMAHEVLIKDKIDVRKYVVGLILPGFEGIGNDIQKILEEGGYKNIKIFHKPNLPNAKELI
ncbi:hypothetical protein QJ856_gp0328 [Tupanvirus deep ocean]|uniref:Uncharacterized protein n=2 Tax=Tupanvirus TaxID=2094720 RepID=A0AC62A9T7_9VIRU|nr:hypothetical protein QJ856_gp0328 [Tupanvirus deep ocean]QKU34408.1 hypothetical protein [Tupanvirus deep ocean]